MTVVRGRSGVRAASAASDVILYAYAVLVWAAVVSVAGGLVYLAPIMRTTVLTLAFALVGQGSFTHPGGGGSEWFVWVFVILMVGLLVRGDRIRKWARQEEVSYRLGSENWTWRKRAKSCAMFGAAHFWNIVLPLSLVIGLALVGAYFMAIYLRAYAVTGSQAVALDVATEAHVAYNRIWVATITVLSVCLLAVSL